MDQLPPDSHWAMASQVPVEAAEAGAAPTPAAAPAMARAATPLEAPMREIFENFLFCCWITALQGPPLRSDRPRPSLRDRPASMSTPSFVGNRVDDPKGTRVRAVLHHPVRRGVIKT